MVPDSGIETGLKKPWTVEMGPCSAGREMFPWKRPVPQLDSTTGSPATAPIRSRFVRLSHTSVFCCLEVFLEVPGVKKGTPRHEVAVFREERRERRVQVAGRAERSLVWSWVGHQGENQGSLASFRVSEKKQVSIPVRSWIGHKCLLMVLS